MKLIAISRTIWLVALFLFAGAHGAVAQAYGFIALPSVDGYVKAFPTSINDSGLVVGYSYNSSIDLSQATIWNGATASLLNNSVSKASQAFGINSAGQVVGTVNMSSTINDWHAVVWGGSTVQDLGPGVAYAINDSGQIAGTNGRQQATTWNGTTSTPLGPGPDQIGAISSNGQIAGASVYNAVIWSGGTPTLLPGLGGLGARAQGINDLGVAVGYSWITGNSTTHATIWNGVAVTDLGSLGGGQGRAFGINDGGTIVGDSSTLTGDQHATIWTSTGPADLNDFVDSNILGTGWRLALATGINSRGAITGLAVNDVSGQWEGFILTPVPEPTNYALLLAGLGLVSITARRQKHRPSA